MFCQTCGAFNTPGAKFCQDCGKNIGAAPASTPDPSGAASSQATRPMAMEPSTDSPGPIWNPGAAASWSLLFTPAFGAYLHMLNWKALGREDKAAVSQTWFYVSLAVLLLYIVPALVFPDSESIDRGMRGIGLAYLLAWYFQSAKEQMKYVKEKFGKDYERRPWGKALGIGILGIFGYFVAALVIGFAWGFLRHFVK